MYKKVIAIVVLLQLFFFADAQKRDSIPDLSKGNYVITNLDKDTVSYRDKASQTLRTLRNGAVIVRLKTNQKSVDAYRNAGKNNIADRIQADRQKQNEKMYQAFGRSFLFCKVFFIYANETKLFLEGNRKIFLNTNLQHDATIVFSDTNFVFCEYGSVESFSKFHDYEPIYISAAERSAYSNVTSYGNISGGIPYIDPRKAKILDTLPIQTSTSPATTSGLFFSDKNLNQLHRPFPFVEGVYMENYDAPIRALNREMERAYGKLVINKDFKEKMKESKKKERRKKKESPKYNPFK